MNSSRTGAIAVATALLVAACGGVATPPPTSGPTSPPTAAPTAASTTVPTASSAPSSTLLPTSTPTSTPTAAPTNPPTTVPSATPGPSVTPVPIGQVDHPTDPTAVVLRMESGGGLVPFGFLVTQAPVFTLYGDNTVIYRPRQPDPAGTHLTPFWRAVLNADQVDALLTYALDAGHLADARESYVDIQVADAPTTYFTVDAGGVKKQVSVYALGVDSPANGPDAADYAAFLKLGKKLSDFEAQVNEGQVESAGVYEPAGYRGVLREGGAPVGIIEWPWTDLAVDDFAVDPDYGYGFAALTPEQVAKVTAEPSGGAYGISLRAPDGNEYSLMLRPLLPGDDLKPPPVR